MSDLIERQAAIDDLHDKDPSQVWDTADIEVWINSFPSAQQVRTQMSSTDDLINRQAAIEALESIGSLDTEADKKNRFI